MTFLGSEQGFMREVKKLAAAMFFYTGMSSIHFFVFSYLFIQDPITTPQTWVSLGMAIIRLGQSGLMASR